MIPNVSAVAISLDRQLFRRYRIVGIVMLAVNVINVVQLGTDRTFSPDVIASVNLVGAVIWLALMASHAVVIRWTHRPAPAPA